MILLLGGMLPFGRFGAPLSLSPVAILLAGNRPSLSSAAPFLPLMGASGEHGRSIFNWSQRPYFFPCGRIGLVLVFVMAVWLPTNPLFSPYPIRGFLSIRRPPPPFACRFWFGSFLFFVNNSTELRPPSERPPF